MLLDRYAGGSFERGASRWKEALWIVLDGLLMSSWFPGSAWRVAFLRLFGAKIGKGVRIKPRVQIKFPWRLTVGDHCWIGERVWIDNLVEVRLGSHVCLSQGVYACTGSHDWARSSFDLLTRSIVIEDHVWVCAKVILAPGTLVERGAVLGFGSVAQGRISGWQIYSGNPARPVKARPQKSC